MSAISLIAPSISTIQHPGDVQLLLSLSSDHMPLVGAPPLDFHHIHPVHLHCSEGVTSRRGTLVPVEHVWVAVCKPQKCPRVGSMLHIYATRRIPTLEGFNSGRRTVYAYLRKGGVISSIEKWNRGQLQIVVSNGPSEKFKVVIWKEWVC